MTPAEQERAAVVREPDEIVRIDPCGSARINVRVYFKPEKMRCHGSRDGECSWVYCPQNRDGEPWKSGRHCPYDHWCMYCGADQTGKEGDCDEC